MSDILFIADFAESTNRLFEKIQSVRHSTFISYDITHITSYLKETTPGLAVISLSSLPYEHEHAVNLLLQSYPKLNYILYGTKEECKDFHGKFNANIVKYIITPTVESDFIKQITEVINRIDGITQTEDSTEKKESDDNRKSILIIDDDIIFLRTLMNYFKDEYKVSVAKSYGDACKVFAKTIPDLILLDYEMPDINGPQALKFIRDDEQLKDIPVFFLTGVSDPAQVKAALVLHPEGYLLKSSGQTELTNRIKDFFKKQNN